MSNVNLIQSKIPRSVNNHRITLAADIFIKAVLKENVVNLTIVIFSPYHIL